MTAFALAESDRIFRVNISILRITVLVVLGMHWARSEEQATVCNFAKILGDKKINVGDTITFSSSRSKKKYENVLIKGTTAVPMPDGSYKRYYQVEHNGVLADLDPERIDVSTLEIQSPNPIKTPTPLSKTKELSYSERVSLEQRGKWILPNSSLSTQDQAIRREKIKSRHDHWESLAGKPAVGSFLEPDPQSGLATSLPSNFKNLASTAKYIFSPEGEKEIMSKVKRMRFVEDSKANATSGSPRQIYEFRIDSNTVASYAVSVEDGVISSRELLIGVKEADGKYRFAGFVEYPGAVVEKNGEKYYLASMGQTQNKESLLRHGGSQECMSCHAFDGSGFYSRNAQGPRVQKYYNGEKDGVAPGAQYLDSRGKIATVLPSNDKGQYVDVVDSDQLYTAF